MDLIKLKNRELDEYLVAVLVIKTEMELELEGQLKKRKMYLFIGINVEGRRKYLTYGVNEKSTSDFWLQKFKNISRRGVEKISYLSLPEEEGRRAGQVIFPGVKIVGSPFKIIEKIAPYFADTYKNTMPEEIRKMYILKEDNEYQAYKKYFLEKYEEKLLVKKLIEKDIISILKVYDIPYNIRKVIFPFYFIREYKRIFKKEVKKAGIIKDVDEFMNKLGEIIGKWEKTMSLSKKEWLEVINRLIEKEEEIERYL